LKGHEGPGKQRRAQGEPEDNGGRAVTLCQAPDVDHRQGVEEGAKKWNEGDALQHSRSGADHDDDTEEAEEAGRPASYSHLFSQEGNRKGGDEERCCKGDSDRVGQLHVSVGVEEEEHRPCTAEAAQDVPEGRRHAQRRTHATKAVNQKGEGNEGEKRAKEDNLHGRVSLPEPLHEAIHEGKKTNSEKHQGDAAQRPFASRFALQRSGSRIFPFCASLQQSGLPLFTSNNRALPHRSALLKRRAMRSQLAAGAERLWSVTSSVQKAGKPLQIKAAESSSPP